MTAKKAAAKVRKPAKKPKNRRSQDWILPEAGMTTKGVGVGKWSGIIVGALLLSVLAVWVIIPFYGNTMKGWYYRYFPTPEMRQLHQLKSTLNLPAPDSVTENDLGCHTEHTLLDVESRCERSMTLDFGTAGFVDSLRRKLESSGWRQKTYDDYGVKTDYDTFHYSRVANGQKFCIDGVVNHDKANSAFASTIWLYTGSDSSCRTE